MQRAIRNHEVSSNVVSLGRSAMPQGRPYAQEKFFFRGGGLFCLGMFCLTVFCLFVLIFIFIVCLGWVFERERRNT